MNSDLQRDLFATFSITNYLAASFQGKFAALNILSQLETSTTYQEEIARTREALSKITRWTTDLRKGTPLFSASWTKAETFEAMKALDYIRALKNELYELTGQVISLLRSNFDTRPDDAKFLIAAFGRFAYARDNYIRGFIDYAKALNSPDMEAQYTPHLPQATQDVQNAHQLLTTFRDANRLDRAFFDRLREMCRDLPTIFRTHLHDINQILATYEGGLNFEAADFSQADAGAWEAAGLGPFHAGYWRAYDFLPEDASDWMRVGVNEAPLGHLWRHAGFTPAEAKPWVPLGIHPDTARAWIESGNSPEQATEHMRYGTNHPSELKKR